jgi:hypothetical protein
MHHVKCVDNCSLYPSAAGFADRRLKRARAALLPSAPDGMLGLNGIHK